MVRIIFFLFLFHARFFTTQSNPLIGQNVRLAENQEFPFIISLSWNKPKDVGKEEQNHVCGGSLITRKHILTVAHCFEDVRSCSRLVAKVGSNDLRAAKTYAIEWWKTYTQWAENEVFFEEDLDHDIAIVKLIDSVSSSIKLPILTRIPEIDLYGKTAMTAGWGLIENYKRPQHLRAGEVRVLRFSESAIYKPEDDRTPLPNNFIFSKAEPYMLMQCGDSGSPLLINKNEIIGVNVARCFEDYDEADLSKSQNAHTSVNYYINFITDMMTK